MIPMLLSGLLQTACGIKRFKMQYDNNGQVTNIQCCGQVPAVVPPVTPSGVLHGFGSPVANGVSPVNGTIYINDTDATFWAVANGVWYQEV